MSNCYAKVIVKGSPISKSNFKLFNKEGRAILPYNSGKYHDRYALYEEEIALEARAQNPGIIIEEACIAILKVFYKSEKRHPDTNNITKSILDGIEKSGLIINDAQVRRLVIEEFYDKENPRFELELFGESSYSLEYSLHKKELQDDKILYSPPSNKKSKSSLGDNMTFSSVSSDTYVSMLNSKEKSEKLIKKKKISPKEIDNILKCDICGKVIVSNDYISANKGKTLICNKCFNKNF
ncbi:Endodeoxyribonuclease RusA [Clostridium collagenovorans DSM 3089]|uniref:Endodeoxyribonuclease RusA n=1 Tax=Clostridium collagenovorans DSM 3089 TaxID=1121306 RepID=A0A1M5VZ09_9CLOT|nr:RusA family crossover junction endodeoxyribonuclease [Clostridium collagenovorans]SHH80234.1 Endodeoxyribonuclease RusA [Clostridium collagenovorans DSM 3089]